MVLTLVRGMEYFYFLFCWRDRIYCLFVWFEGQTEMGWSSLFFGWRDRDMRYVYGFLSDVSKETSSKICMGLSPSQYWKSYLSLFVLTHDWLDSWYNTQVLWLLLLGYCIALFCPIDHTDHKSKRLRFQRKHTEKMNEPKELHICGARATQSHSKHAQKWEDVTNLPSTFSSAVGSNPTAPMYFIYLFIIYRYLC